MRNAVLMLGLLAGCAAPAPLASPTAHPFDGRWAVTQTCPAMALGVRGYVYQFPAYIRDSVFRGEQGREGEPGWLLLRGPVQRDGRATLEAQGLTGTVETTAGFLASSTPYRYTVEARFQPRSGQGRRIEVRTCTLDFARA
ncbi:MAG: hypothetical protein V4653_18105 [Pseudomonadota bacterium]